MMRAERVLYFKSFWVLPPLAIAAVVATTRWGSGTTSLHLLWTLPLGLVLWTLIEYGLHRFVFHWQPKHPAIAATLDALHHRHHVEPSSRDFLLVRLPYALVISAGLAAGLWGLTDNLAWTAGLMSGIWAGFLWYESVHYRIHQTEAAGGWIARRRRAHFVHHFRNSRRCFGVTTSVWDRVFGSG